MNTAEDLRYLSNVLLFLADLKDSGLTRAVIHFDEWERWAGVFGALGYTTKLDVGPVGKPEVVILTEA